MIHIYGNANQLNPIKAKLSDVIHGAMMAALGLPAGKRAHRFFPMQPEDFYMPDGRSPAYTVIEIKMIQGRAVDTLKALIKRLFRDIEQEVGLAPADVEITILEQPAHCWGFRGMTGDEAQLDYQINV